MRHILLLRAFQGLQLVFDYLKATFPKRNTAQDRFLQERFFYGKEKKFPASVIVIMNLILHGIEARNVIHTNTLAENLADIQPKDQLDIAPGNPPSKTGTATKPPPTAARRTFPSAKQPNAPPPSTSVS